MPPEGSGDILGGPLISHPPIFLLIAEVLYCSVSQWQCGWKRWAQWRSHHWSMPNMMIPFSFSWDCFTDGHVTQFCWMSYDEKSAGKPSKRFPPWEMSKGKINPIPCPGAFLLLDKVLWGHEKAGAGHPSWNHEEKPRDFSRKSTLESRKSWILNLGNRWASCCIGQLMS